MEQLALELIGLYFLGATLPSILFNRPLSRSALTQFIFALVLLAYALAEHYGHLR